MASSTPSAQACEGSPCELCTHAEAPLSSPFTMALVNGMSPRAFPGVPVIWWLLAFCSVSPPACPHPSLSLPVGTATEVLALQPPLVWASFQPHFPEPAGSTIFWCPCLAFWVSMPTLVKPPFSNLTPWLLGQAPSAPVPLFGRLLLARAGWVSRRRRVEPYSSEHQSGVQGCPGLAGTSTTRNGIPHEIPLPPSRRKPWGTGPTAMVSW